MVFVVGVGVLGGLYEGREVDLRRLDEEFERGLGEKEGEGVRGKREGRGMGKWGDREEV
ncbi:predicted protein [Sclerotinia sclerotiorum 1980 UF-70]|uniref:Uncharacterized protein n=1 Tax=Sclerotinia sclerotiorum (strain ATCC 18683 / 1980 / Ss-1) TaxID=665079 RepID=A7EMQ1_SCLS1|nr:predicted protein [Sclerotinia sclerotiorum 1980 UF-70]EDO04117.1 predicted protein [Sclerotinia sclerotiorum 1980 UF-70]